MLPSALNKLRRQIFVYKEHGHLRNGLFDAAHSGSEVQGLLDIRPLKKWICLQQVLNGVPFRNGVDEYVHRKTRAPHHGLSRKYVGGTFNPVERLSGHTAKKKRFVDTHEVIPDVSNEVHVWTRSRSLSLRSSPNDLPVQRPHLLAHPLHGERLPNSRRPRLGHAPPPSVVRQYRLKPHRNGRRVRPVDEDAQPVCPHGGLSRL